MATAPIALVERVRALGLACDSLPTDRLDPAAAALACFPMYMVANVHAWTGEAQFHVPLLDLPGSEQLFESYALGQQEGKLRLDEAHRKVLRAYLGHARPADRIIYDHALATLAEFLSIADPAVAAELRRAVAAGVVAVAEAAGKGLLGSGRKVSAEERLCIDAIAQTLDLRSDPEAARALAAIQP